ncbi:hypothetical protein [Streptomyces sp. NPDC001137]|uniref:hypothetical protein n=1 Tax=Streptomyces sp. NPDC001137 TaxID=3154378 RepID=UPI003319CBF4
MGRFDLIQSVLTYRLSRYHPRSTVVDRADATRVVDGHALGYRLAAERFEQLALTLETFFLERLATSEYARLALVDDDLVVYDVWLKLLRQASLAG